MNLEVGKEESNAVRQYNVEEKSGVGTVFILFRKNINVGRESLSVCLCLCTCSSVYAHIPTRNVESAHSHMADNRQKQNTISRLQDSLIPKST